MNFNFFHTCLTLLLLPALLSAKTIVVAPGTAVASLKRAVEIAKNGDTILVRKGTYKSINTVINKEVTVLGQGNPVLDANFEDEAVTITASNVKFEGFTVKNTKTGALRDYAGIRLFRVKNVTIMNNQFINNFFGIYVSDSYKITVTNNKLSGTFDARHSGNGIHIWKSDSVLVKNNRITGHRDGAYFEFVKHSVIENNVSEKNSRYGLHFMFSNDNVYMHNIFKSNGAGVAVMYSKRIKMLKNRFVENWGSSIYGLLLKEILDSRIEENQFITNTSAIFMESCNRNEILDNDFQNNGWAVRILSNCEDNVFSKNNFKANTFDATTNGTLRQNQFNNNYWDKYEGYDLDKNGLGDIPYRPVSLYAQIIERIPQSVMLMRSFIVNLLDKVERSIPSITPESVKDENPKMKPWTR